MTVVPLPDVPCVRVRLIYEPPAGNEAGSRFYLSYSGSAPSGADCTTLAGDVESAWVTNLAPLTPDFWSLNEVDVLDIATDAGLSGQATTAHDGTRSGTDVATQVATNVEFDIARRYRGGKPRMFLPPGVTGDTADSAHWTSAFITAVNTGVAAFFAELEALDIGSMGTLQHVNLSYYKGFHNITNSSGRERAAPLYRDTALHDNIEGYSCKTVMGSQRRRRSSTTP